LICCHDKVVFKSFSHVTPSSPSRDRHNTISTAMPIVRTLPSLKARQPRLVPYEQVIALEINPARQPHQPPPYAQYPPNAYYPPGTPPQQPLPLTNGTANPPPPAAGPPQQLQWQPPEAGTASSHPFDQQEGYPPTAVAVRDRNTDDDDTKLVRAS
jgi:hypothetical protein